MTAKIYYVSSCPVCAQGLVRVRIQVVASQMSPVFVCDECDAAWADPDLANRMPWSSAEKNDLWGENTHWATAPEIALLGLHRQITVADVPIDGPKKAEE